MKPDFDFARMSKVQDLEVFVVRVGNAFAVLPPPHPVGFEAPEKNGFPGQGASHALPIPAPEVFLSDVATYCAPQQPTEDDWKWVI